MRYKFVLHNTLFHKVRFISKANPLRWKIVFAGKPAGYIGAGSRPVAVVDGGFVGEPRSPPSVTSRRQYQRVTRGQQRHVKSDAVTFRVHNASVGTVPVNRFQSDVFLGPAQTVRCHDKLHRRCYVYGEVFGGLNVVRSLGNCKPIVQIEQRQDVSCTHVDSDTQERRVPGSWSNFVQEPANSGEQTVSRQVTDGGLRGSPIKPRVSFSHGVCTVVYSWSHGWQTSVDYSSPPLYHHICCAL